jgi:hypothetical protein
MGSSKLVGLVADYCLKAAHQGTARTGDVRQSLFWHRLMCKQASSVSSFRETRPLMTMKKIQPWITPDRAHPR